MKKNDLETLSSVSTRIRERIKKNGGTFLANDNISEYIKPGELIELGV